MEEVKFRELPEKHQIQTSDYLAVEDEDGTKKVLVRHFRSLVLNTLYFETIEELKDSPSRGLKEGDICETLGYHYPGDGGGAKYRITYNPAAVEDGKLVHYLSYSDTLRAEIILDDKINVNQFGAKGDGSTDDTKAIQAAIDNSDNRVVEFSNNKTYIIRDSIRITKDNTIIKGNGAILYPHYIDGIIIGSEQSGDDPTQNVNIENLHFNCSKASCAIKAENVTNLNIIRCNVNNISSKGFILKIVKFVNIDKCLLSGENGNTLISFDHSLRYSDLTTPYDYINISNCRFEKFYRAIEIINMKSSESEGEIGDTHSINITNCVYDNGARNSVNGSTCIYLASIIGCMNITNNTIRSADTFLDVGASSKSGIITCRNLNINVLKVFNISSSYVTLLLDGNININTRTVRRIFVNMAGILLSNVFWGLSPIDAIYSGQPTGELHDYIHPTQYNEIGLYGGYYVSGSSLTLEVIRNVHVDWSSSTSNLSDILGGIKGQLIYIKSSTNKSILNVTNKIVLSDTSIQLGPYKGILLKYDGLKWIQIQ